LQHLFEFAGVHSKNVCFIQYMGKQNCMKNADLSPR
jgi:hypothetical protein